MPCSAARFSSLVIGSGPCGIVAASTLASNSSGGTIAWVSSEADPSLIGGRFNRYRKVPGNTPAGVLKAAFSSIPAMHFNRLQAARRKSGATLSDIPDTDTCELGLAIDALSDSASFLVGCDDLTVFNSTWVDRLALHTATGAWTATTSDGRQIAASSVLLVPGAVPRAHGEMLSGLKTLPVLEAVTPGHDCLSMASGRVTTVVGNSHTGMLVAKNLLSHQNPASEVNVVALAPVVQAEYRGGWTKYDGSGLRGTVAEWVRQGAQVADRKLQMHLLQEPEALGDEIERLGTEVVCFATGFVRSSLPAINIDGVLHPKLYD